MFIGSGNQELDIPFLEVTIQPIILFIDEEREGKGKSRRYDKQSSQNKMKEIQQ